MLDVLISFAYSAIVYISSHYVVCFEQIAPKTQS